jgi:hypothetical protein
MAFLQLSLMAASRRLDTVDLGQRLAPDQKNSAVENPCSYNRTKDIVLPYNLHHGVTYSVGRQRLGESGMLLTQRHRDS